MKREDSRPPNRAWKQPRKRYEKPVLETYGDLTELTQSLKGKNKKDGAAHANKHFTS